MNIFASQRRSSFTERPTVKNRRSLRARSIVYFRRFFLGFFFLLLPLLLPLPLLLLLLLLLSRVTNKTLINETIRLLSSNEEAPGAKKKQKQKQKKKYAEKRRNKTRFDAEFEFNLGNRA